MHQPLSRLVIGRLRNGLNRKVMVVLESLSRIGLHIDAVKNLVVASGVLPPDTQLVNQLADFALR